MPQQNNERILQNINFRIILGIVVMAVIGGSLIGPILPSMIQPLHSSEELIGLVLSVYTLCALISTPFLGVLADRYGRKTVIVPAMILYGIAGFAIAFMENFIWVIILRGLQGIGAAGMMSLGVTLIGDIFKEKKRAIAMGYRSSAQHIINAIVPFASGAIATFAWFYPFYIYILSVPLAIFTYFKLNVSARLNQTTISDYFKSIFIVLKNRQTIYIYGANFFIFLLLYCLIVYVPIYIVKELQLSTFYTGLLLSTGSATAAITASQNGKLFYALRKPVILISGFLLCGIALLLIALSPSYILLFLCIILWGGGFGLVFPTLNTMATQLVSSHLRAGIVSGFTMMTYIGQTLSPPLFGAILSFNTLQMVFIIAGATSLIPIIITLIAIIQPHNKAT